MKQYRCFVSKWVVNDESFIDEKDSDTNRMVFELSVS